jgi:hypothetical protein
MLVEVGNGATARYFDRQAEGTYKARFALPDKLTYDSAAGQYELTDGGGNRLHFWDFDQSRPVAARGRFAIQADPYVHLTQVVAETTDGKILEVQRSDSARSVVESYLYEHATSGATPGCCRA